MKVLHVFNEIRFSGAETMYAKAATAFKKKGVNCIAVSTGEHIGDYSNVFIKNGIKVFHIPLKKELSFSFFFFIKELQNLILKENVDVLHIHRSNLFLTALIAKKIGLPCIKTMHNVFRNRKFTYPYGIFLRYFGRHFLNIKFHSISESVYKNEKKYYKNPSVKINNWYDSSVFYPGSEYEKIAIRKELNITKDTFVLISVGKCTKIKNHNDILKALVNLKDRDILYLHLGEGETECEEIQNAKNYGISSKVRFLKNQEDVRKFVLASDIFVMPSKFEGLGISCLEAMACAKPTILYDVYGLRDLINNNDNGFLIPSDYTILSEKIDFFYRNPEEVVLKGKSGNEFAQNNFSLEPNVEKIINLYKKELDR